MYFDLLSYFKLRLSRDQVNVLFCVLVVDLHDVHEGSLRFRLY